MIAKVNNELYAQTATEKVRLGVFGVEDIQHLITVHLKDLCRLYTKAHTVTRAGTCLCNITLSVTEGPHDGVNNQFELVGRHCEEGSKAVVGDGPQQAEELQSVLGKLLHGSMAANQQHKRDNGVWTPLLGRVYHDQHCDLRHMVRCAD